MSNLHQIFRKPYLSDKDYGHKVVSAKEPNNDLDLDLDHDHDIDLDLGGINCYEASPFPIFAKFSENFFSKKGHDHNLNLVLDLDLDDDFDLYFPENDNSEPSTCH